MTAPETIPEEVGVRANMVFIKILPISGNISSNNIGRLPVTSIRGGKYIIVMEDYGSDAILEDPLTSSADTKLLCAVTKLYGHLKEKVLQPRLHMLDNERSSLMNKFIRELGGKHQLVSQGLHRSLIEERAIQTFKYHLISGLSICDPNSPLHLWDGLIRQAELTLNLLHQAPMNPRLSIDA